MLTDLLDLVWEDAEALGCAEQAAAAQMILRDGTSADRQLGIYDDRLAKGASPADAIRAVVDWLADTTATPAKIAMAGGLLGL
jgi:carboxylate-amine ligase